MSIDLQLLTVAFMIGIGSTGHCMMMCGGISSALATSLSEGSAINKAFRLLCFHGGRLLCYSLLGLIFGGILHSGIDLPKPVMMGIRYFAAIMLILIGLYVAGLSQVLRHLENRLGFLWRKVQPIIQKHMPIQHWYQALLVGFLWGFLPCGIVYSTVLWAGSSTMNTSAAVLMFTFGLGTLPGLLVMNLAGQQMMGKLQHRFPKRALGIAMVLFGIWTLPMISGGHWHGSHGAHGSHSSHGMHQQENSTQDTMPNAPADSTKGHPEMHHHHH